MGSAAVPPAYRGASGPRCEGADCYERKAKAALALVGKLPALWRRECCEVGNGATDWNAEDTTRRAVRAAGDKCFHSGSNCRPSLERRDDPEDSGNREVRRSFFHEEAWRLVGHDQIQRHQRNVLPALFLTPETIGARARSEED